MTATVKTSEQYMEQLAPDRQVIIEKLRMTILRSLPNGFIETISYGNIAYVVSHSLYPAGYHCNPKEPLPFISIASQKNFVTIHHMGIYADPLLAEWLKNEYPKHGKTKIDLGKGSIRFKKLDQIPFDLISELATKLNPKEWIEMYEAKLKPSK